MKKYRVNSSEHFNLYSMYEHLKCLEEDMFQGATEWDDSVTDRVEEIEKLLDAAPCVGSLVDWPTLKRIREIQAERQTIRYNRCLAAGMPERDAILAYSD